MRGIFSAQYRAVCRDAPVDAQLLVEDADSAFRFRMIEFVAFILEHGCLAQHRKAMGKALGDEELPVIVWARIRATKATVIEGTSSAAP